MRDKIARLMMNKDNEMGECWCVWEDTSLDADATRASYRVTANQILALIRKEIKKMEKANSYPKAKLASAEYYEGEGFYRACQKILAMFKEG